MKRTLIVFSMLMFAAFGASAMDVDEIVANNIEAKGGQEAWEAVKTLKMTGKMAMMGGAAGNIEMPFSVEFKRPDKVRVEFTMQGMTAIQAYDGTVGWAVMPFMGKPDPEEMAEDQLKQIKDQAEFDGVLFNYKEKGHTVEYLGNEEVDGTPAIKLKVTKANGDVDFLFLDEEYFVEFRAESTREIQGNEIQAATVFGDYKEVGGLMFAHSMELAYGGASEAAQVVTIEQIEIDSEIADDRFTMPEKKTEEAPATE
jgi:hypothetical protein